MFKVSGHYAYPVFMVNSHLVDFQSSSGECEVKMTPKMKKHIRHSHCQRRSLSFTSCVCVSLSSHELRNLGSPLLSPPYISLFLKKFKISPLNQE